MRPRCSLTIFVCVLVGASVLAQAPASQEGPTLNPLWNITTDFAAPESAYYHSGSNAIFVSSINGQILENVKVDGAQVLNDLAAASDGTVYVSDSAQSRIYAVKDGTSSVFVEGADVVEQPNGLLVDRDRLILGTIGPAAPRGGGPGREQAPPARGRGEAGRGDAAPPARGRGPAPNGHLFAFDR